MMRPLLQRRAATLLAAVLLISAGAVTVSAAGWQTEIVDSADRVGLFTSLALDSAGNPRISYYDETHGDLRYARHDGSAWRIETVDAAGTVGLWTSLALDGAGNPRISYYDETHGDLKYAWRDGSGWHTEIVDANGWVGGHTSLALDASGNPRISYYDYTNADLKYAWRDGAGWRTETVESLRIVGWYSSLALDAAGNPRISYLYENSDDLKYAWRDGAGWHTETVDAEGYVGKCSSLVLDAAGNPRISYFDDSNDTDDNLKYAWRDGTGWHTEIVDATGWVGWYTSLALDAAGNPRVSYFDETNDDLRYAWRDGAGWHTGTVDSAGVVGLWTSLALDGAGSPRISYLDYENGDLKYARPEPVLPGAVAVPGASALPTDPDGDGLYEDVNGNGRKDFADIALFFDQMNWIATNEPLVAFDYGRNGRIDFADVVCLFEALGTQPSTPITATFTMDRTSGTAPLAVRFISTSTGPFDHLSWTVSGGPAPDATMTGAAPVHTFEAAGTYTIALTARNSSTNLSDTISRSVTVTAPAGANGPYPSAHSVPGRVEAEDYDRGGFSDTTAVNEGGVYRFDAVDVEEVGGNYNVAWIRAGEYLNYSVDTAGGGTFALTLRMSNPEATTKVVRIRLDGAPAGQVAVAPTGGWLNYREFAASAPLPLAPGRHVVTVSFEGVTRLNFDWLSLAATASTPTPIPTATPTPTPTAISTATPTPTPTVTPTVTATATPTESATPGPSYTLLVASLDLVNERVSVRNTGDAPVELQGCTLSDEGPVNVYTFPSFPLGPGATVTVHTGYGANTGTALYWGLAAPVWDDTRDTATLKQPDGTVISALSRMYWP